MTPKTFDRDEMIRLTRDGMEHSLKFFLNLNESVLKMGETHREAAIQANRQALELMNKSYEEYQRTSRVILSRIEENCKSLLQTTIHAAERVHGQK
jgi:hypothetical protein